MAMYRLLAGGGIWLSCSLSVARSCAAAFISWGVGLGAASCVGLPREQALSVRARAVVMASGSDRFMLQKRGGRASPKSEYSMSEYQARSRQRATCLVPPRPHSLPFPFRNALFQKRRRAFGLVLRR